MKSSGLRHKQAPKNDLSEIDMDPYSTSIIDQLLDVQSPSEWRNQDEIVKLTFKAFKDFVDLHSNDIKDLKTLLTTRAAKQEVSTGLSLKANVSDLTRIIEEISHNLDSKISYSDLNVLLSEYARKKELSEILMLHEMRNEKEGSKVKQMDRDVDMKYMEVRFENFQKEICKKLGSFATVSELQELSRIVDNKVNVTEINDVLENRVTKQYLSNCLQKKVSKSEIEGLLVKKAEVSDLELIISSLEMKASLPTIEKLTQIIENKADRSDLMILGNERKLTIDDNNERLLIMKQGLENKILNLERELENSRMMLNDGIKIIEKDNEVHFRNFISNNEMTLILSQFKGDLNEQISKVKMDLEDFGKSVGNQLNYESFKRELTNEINLRKRVEEKIYEEIDDVRKRVEEISLKKLEKTEYFNFKSELAEELDQKIETEHVQEAFNKWEIEITQKGDSDKEEIYQLIRRVQQTITDSINQNSKDINEIMIINSHKNDGALPDEIMRKNRKEIEECRKTVDSVYNELRSKLDISEYESDLLEIRKKFDCFERENNLKANIKDVCVLADSKPNIEDVNKALKEVKSALETKISETDIEEIVKDQSTINETLLCQNIIGRWLWQSGELKAGGLIPWEMEYANTVPDYYFWEKDKSSILILVSGMYEITSTIFGRNNHPNIIINGEPVRMKEKESENINNSNVGVSRKLSKKMKEKDIVGNKMIEFLMLPARSRVSVIVPLEGSEGFLNIKRL